jgi:hypothetical protein
MMMSRMPIIGDNSYIDRWAYVPQDMQALINVSKPLSPSFNPMEINKIFQSTRPIVAAILTLAADYSIRDTFRRRGKDHASYHRVI